MSSEHWGGSAGAGGFGFQAAVSAFCMVYMVRAQPLGWSDSVNDTPTGLLAETAGPGDDIALQLIGGGVMEVQAKRKLKADESLWGCLLALCARAHSTTDFHGVLAVGPATSVGIRDLLARDLIRLGQGRTDDLSANALTLVRRLTEAGIPSDACARVRIRTIHVLNQGDASAAAAIAQLAHISTSPVQAWQALCAEGLRLIELRGRHDASSLCSVIPDLRADTDAATAPYLVAKRLLDWTLKSTGVFTIPAIKKTFSLDNDWIQLFAHGYDAPEQVSTTLPEALTRYQAGTPRSGGRAVRDQRFAAETLGYFIRHAVIVAGPGMGKTQLIRKMTRVYAKKGHPVIFARLRPLAERMRNGDTFIEAALRIGLDTSGLSPHDVETIGLENLTFLLDGLDEAGREQEAIATAAQSLAAQHPRCRIVITTRPIGYETALLTNWRHYELLSIEGPQAENSLVHLVDAASDLSNEGIQKAKAAARSLLSDRREQEFKARSPLLIAMLASLALNEIVAAVTREGLYAQLLRLIERVADQYVSATTPPAAILNSFLQHLGWHASEHPYARIDALLDACASGLAQDMGEPFLRARATCDHALEFWEAAGIIERVRHKNDEALTFIHKTFGEYAAAKYLQSRERGDRAELLATIEAQEQWHEVVTFAAGLGLGEELVALAFSHGDSVLGIQRALVWAKHSDCSVGPALAERIQRASWQNICGPHSGQATSIGLALLRALDKVPARSAPDTRSHKQWWTALVGWTYFVRSKAKEIDFTHLNSAMEAFREEVNNRLDNHSFASDPVHRVWEMLLVGACEEFVRRPVEGSEKKFLEALQSWLNDFSIGFIWDLSSIFEAAGRKLTAPSFEFSRTSFDPEYAKKRMVDSTAFLYAFATDGENNSPAVQAPFLHLSAFIYGTGFMQMELSAAALVGTRATVETKEILALAARHTSEDYGQLVAEARAKVHEFSSADPLSGLYKGIIPVDCITRWGSGGGADVKRLLKPGLLHPSKYIALLVGNLAEHHCGAADLEDQLPFILATADYAGLYVAGHLAVKFLEREKAQEMLLVRLKQPLNSGCTSLYDYLSTIWDSSLDQEACKLLQRGLYERADTGEACLKLFHACQKEVRTTLIPLLKAAYFHWLKLDEPTGVTTSPSSLLNGLLMALEAESALSVEELIEAVQDGRSEIATPAMNALVRRASVGEPARKELVQRITSNESLHRVVDQCLSSDVPFDTQDVDALTKLLTSPTPENRHAALGVLSLRYMSLQEVERWACLLSEDSRREIRDKAYDKVSAARRELIPAAAAIETAKLDVGSQP